MIRIGLVGCGRIAQLVHLRELTSLSGIRVTAIAEPDEDRLARAAARVPAADRYRDYRDLVRESGVDAVVLSLSADLHADAAIASFEAGKHIYLEKPIATNLASADAVVEAWKRAGLIGMMGFNFRFHPCYRRVRRLLAGGRVGPVVALRTVFSSAKRSLPSWKRSRATGGGALLDLGSHHIDLIRFISSAEVAEVSATISSRCTEDDTAFLQLRLTSGWEVQSLFSLATIAEDRLEAHGEGGKLSSDRYADRIEIRPPVLPTARADVFRRATSDFVRGLRGVWRKARQPSFGDAFEAFAAAVEGGERDIPTLEDGYRCLQVVLAAERSAESGGVTLPRRPDASRQDLATTVRQTRP